jgi:hypothetical protein
MSETRENDSSAQAVTSENPRDFDVKRNRTYALYYKPAIQRSQKITLIVGNFQTKCFNCNPWSFHKRRWKDTIWVDLREMCFIVRRRGKWD